MAYLRWRWLFTLAVSSTTCQSFDVNIHSTPRRSAGGTIASMHSSPHLRLPTHHLCCARRSTNTNSHLYLFDPLMQNQSARVNGRKRCPNHIPEEDLDFLRYFSENSDTPPFPYSIDLGDAQSYANTRLIVRHLEDEDIVKVLPEVVREFGALTAPPPSVDRVLADELSDKIENYLFSLTVLIGLTQRVVRRQKGYSPTNSACPDHNVVCLVELNTITRTEEIVGIAELSWQIPNPNGNAPPFVLPYFMKVLLSRLFSIINDDATSDTSPVGYISNVLVWKTRRGRGYARILMAALEGIARLWGCNDVRLHVDADEYSGRIARSLYWDLGYEGVPDRGESKNQNYDWIGSMTHQGLYLVDGVPLLYLLKDLKDK